MPIQMTRPVTVYRLWDNDDLRECFEVLAAQGWLCSLVADGNPVVWRVHLQHNKRREQVTAAIDDVVVWDGVSPQTHTVDEFNAAAAPGDRIKGSK